MDRLNTRAQRIEIVPRGTKMEPYGLNKRVVELALHPKNVGTIRKPDGYARIENPVCGDITDLYIRVQDGRIRDARLKTMGCFVTIASASALTQAVRGKSVQDLLQGDESEIIGRLLHLIMTELGEIPRRKWHCPPACIEALLRSLQQYLRRQRDEETVRKIEDVLSLLKPYYKRGGGEPREN